MDVNNAETIQAICGLFQQTLSDVKLQRAKAEHELNSVCVQPGFSTLLLQCIQSSQIPDNIRLSMAAYFKNHMKKKWIEIGAISEEEKNSIKSILPSLMLSLSRQLQRNIAEALNIVSSYDFPEKWTNLLPDLVEKLKTPDFNMINGVLKTIDSIFKRFRNANETDHAQMTSLKYSLQTFTSPFLYLFKATSEQITQQASNPQALEVLFRTVSHLCSIFLSLNSVTIPEFMEDNLAEFMSAMKFYLTYKSESDLLMEGKKDDSPGLLTRVQVSVLTVINLYCEKYEEEFTPYIQQFVTEVWQLLISISPKAKFDSLVTSSLRFLNTIATSGVFYTMFQNDEVLSQICSNVIVPNIKLRKSDKELFEDEPLAYVGKDVEGNDDGTRRRSAYTLVIGLRRNFEAKLTGLFSNYVNTLLQEYSTDPSKNWASKDAAVYIIIALAATKGTSERGVTTVNALVPVLDFYRSQILVELRNEKAQPLLLCSCMNYATTFRRQFSLDDFNELLIELVKNLQSNSEALRSYAALAIERFLAIREDNNKYRFQKEHISQSIQPLFQNLFAALDCQGKSENHYIMKAIAQVITIAKDSVFPLIQPAIQALSQKLLVIYASPYNAEFGHFLFESIAGIISVTCRTDPSNIDKFEEALFPTFYKILTEPEAGTYTPFVFQVMSMLIELRKSLDVKYHTLFDELTKAHYWEEVGNRPALVRLIQAYITYGGSTLFPNAQAVSPVLGIFQKLISNKQQDYLGFFLLESVVVSLDKRLFAEFLPQIYKLIFTRITTVKTEQVVKSFILFLSIFLNKYGVSSLIEGLHQAQDGIFNMVLTSLWIPNVSKVLGNVERKCIACGTISLLRSDITTTLFQNEQGMGIVRDMIDSLLLLFSGETNKTVDESYVDAGDLVYNSGFSALKNAGGSTVDHYATVPDARSYFANSLKELSGKHGQQLSQILGSFPQEKQQSLMGLLKSANVTL